MVRKALPSITQRTHQSSTATSSDMIKELDDHSLNSTNATASAEWTEKGDGSDDRVAEDSCDHAQIKESMRGYDCSPAHSDEEVSGSSPTPKVLSNGSMNEEDGGADWSPEIPFRDLNDLVRLSVDEDSGTPYQKEQEERPTQTITADNQVTGTVSQQPRQSQHLLDPGCQQGIRVTSEKTSLLVDHSAAVPAEDPTSVPAILTVAEQVDMILDQYIEIESNKRMMEENVSWFCLTFKLQPMECKFHQVKDMVFKSNAVCVCIAWFFLSCSQLLVLPMYVAISSPLHALQTPFTLLSWTAFVRRELLSALADPESREQKLLK